MIKLDRKTYDKNIPITATVHLPIDTRIKSRCKIILDDGRDAGIILTRGESLKHGDVLTGSGADVIQVLAANENVSTVTAPKNVSLVKAAYHLGNRHVPLQIDAQFLRYQHDKVLDDMLIKLGFEVSLESAPFEPEPGAYGQHSTAHSHVHG